MVSLSIAVYTQKSLALVVLPSKSGKADYRQFVPSSLNKHVGKIDNSGSIVYLGNGWVITALHVGAGKISLNGKKYVPDFKSVVQLSNNDRMGTPDMMMFKLRIAPNDPLMSVDLLPISKNLSGNNTEIALSGYGFKAISNFLNNYLAQNTKAGMSIPWGNPGSLLWGRAKISNPKKMWLKKAGMYTAIYYSKFENMPFAGQATSGDSGGGAFTFNRNKGRWELAGIIIAYLGQPGVSEIGNATMISYIQEYRNQILNIAKM